MVAKNWLIKKLKRELIKIKIWSGVAVVFCYLTWILKFFPFLDSIHIFCENFLMGVSMAHYDTNKSIKDCQEHDRIMGVSSEEFGYLYKNRSDEEQRKMMY